MTAPIKIELGVPDLIALVALAELLAEHLEQSEDRRDTGLLPSDRARGIINTLTRDRSGDV